MDDVPFEVVVNNFNGEGREERASLIQNAAADSWEDAEWDKKEEVNEKIEQWRQSALKPTDNRSTDDDLFNTLEPKITSAKKVVIKPKGFDSNPAPKRNIFEFNEEKMGASTTLGEIDDDLMGWGDDLDITLKQHRDEQNKQRQLEHEKRLFEKKMQSQNQNII